jgi:hypothetical protein
MYKPSGWLEHVPSPLTMTLNQGVPGPVLVLSCKVFFLCSLSLGK